MSVTLVGRTESSSTTSTMTGVIPSGTVAGDVLLWFLIGWGRFPSATPSGWTGLGDVSFDASTRLYVYGKTAVGGDSASVQFTGTGNAHHGQVHSYRGVDTSNPWDGINGGLTGSIFTGTHVVPGVTTTSPNTYVVRCLVTNSTSSGRTYSWSTAQDPYTTRGPGGYRYISTASNVYASPQSTGTSTATFSTSNPAIAACLGLRARVSRMRLGSTPKRVMLGSKEVFVNV